MLNEIELLESLVQGHLCNTTDRNHDYVFDDFELSALDKLIRKALIKSVFELKKDHLIDIFIQDVQKRFIVLSNNLYAYAVSKPFARKNRLRLFSVKNLLKTVDNLLIYLCDSFSKFINLDLYIPENLRLEKISTFKCQLFQIEKLYEQESELNQILVNTVKQIIHPNLSITYRQLQYLSFLLQELLNHDGSLKVRLVKTNFNCSSFLHYLIMEIESDLDELESYSDKMAKLFWNLKWFKQMQITELAFNISLKTVKDLLIDWLNEEITFLEKSANLKKLSKNEAEVPEDKEFKFITDLSVPQLGFLIRIFMDCGIFKNKNHRAVAKFFAKHTQTKGCDSISAGNLLNKFYDVSENAEEVVKSIIIKMLNQIQKY